MSSYGNIPPNNPPGDDLSSQAARRARLRGSIGKAAVPEGAILDAESPEPNVVAPQNTPGGMDADSSGASVTKLPLGGANYQFGRPDAQDTAANTAATAAASAAASAAELELLSSIDQAMNSCATNLAALQTIAQDQTTVLQTVNDTLRNQTLFEIGLNLNSLSESLTAALEPMKAVGELVPAIDQLVAAIEAQQANMHEKISPDQLVSNLADQLSSGLIDPWTFKCAYTAVFPGDHPADLLRRLVELLGTQRLSGDLFRSAYEAVQAAEPPPRPNSGSGGGSGGAVSSEEAARNEAMNEEIRQQLEALKEANDELKRSLEEREEEFEQLLASKDQELHEAQELLNSRYEEFNSRYEEVTGQLSKREDEYRSLLENKDIVLSEKESELNLLRAQMEELRQQTQDMVKDLQKEMADVRIAKEAASATPTLPPKPAASSFFDTAPTTTPSSLFDTAPSAPLFSEQRDSFAPAPNPPQPPAPPQPAPAPAPAPQPAAQAPAPPVPPAPAVPPAPQPAPPPQPVPPAPAAAPSPSTQAVARPAPAAAPTFGSSGAGSYGSGVRAQVFEVIVRQALAGAPWREICAGPMQVNNISPDEVEAEVKRRQALLNK